MAPDDDVERRAGVRGPRRDLWAELPGGARHAVLEAGKKTVFIAHDDPDAIALGARIEIAVVTAAGAAGAAGAGASRVIARCEVVRKELQPRKGVALLIVHMTPAAEAAFVAMLGE